MSKSKTANYEKQEVFNLNTDFNMLSEYSDVLNPSDLIQILDVGKNTVYKLLKDNIIHSVKIGKKYKIPKIFLIEYLVSC